MEKYPFLPKSFGRSKHLAQKASSYYGLKSFSFFVSYLVPLLLTASCLSIFQVGQQFPCLLYFLENFLHHDSQVTEHFINLSCS